MLPRDRGFSFIELLAYMAIAALLILAAIPQFNNYRGQARDQATMNDVRNVAVAYEAWAVSHPGESFPYVRQDWASATTGLNILSDLGVTLGDDTKLLAEDRLDSTAPTTAFTARGQAFCIFAYNENGQKYKDTFSAGGRLAYHSGNGGLQTECWTK